MKKLLIIALCCILSACGNTELPDSTPLTENQATIAGMEELTVTPERSNKDLNAAPTTTATTPNLIQATIYYGNDNADGLEYKTVLVHELNTDTLIAELIEVGVLSEGTAVLSEKHVGSCLHIDFNSVFRDRICSMGTAGEYIIVGSLVNTFVDNFKDTTESIYITVEGETLESGHVVYDFELAFYN